ncbi:hypothetical protein [Altererythrobacter sp. Root672]|uniref:hypothetical protein n=1 Tax=Altererythrobacter sp. Root672 TaxID=1736584 RepID=UPI0006FAE57B|nr:hypothetical protein [Altererythrobacter sp. Root672]KRA84193.1 hypothetical protein ASD76_09440 [Altererythrobacter sp. Root672]
MATVSPVKTPKHLWLVGIVSLLWNAVGATDYTMTALGNTAYLESMGFGPEEQAWVAAFPAWAVAVWAIGVWGSIVGSILLLMRSRHAVTAFIVSALGAVGSFAYQFTSDRPASMEGGGAVIMPVVIIILIVAQWYYARRMAAAGVLR